MPSPVVKDSSGQIAAWSNDGLKLAAESHWVVEGSQAELDTLESELAAGLAERLTSTCLVLNFGNKVGSFDTSVLGRIDVHSSKWTEADYDSMLEDLVRVAATLPFGVGAASTGTSRDDMPATALLYHCFSYLRTVALGGPGQAYGSLVREVAGVLRDPHRTLVRERQVRPVHQVSGLSSGLLVDMVAGRHVLVKTPRCKSSTAVRLGGRLPEEVADTRVIHNVDNGENRFVKAFLGTCTSLVDEVRRVAAQELKGPTRDRVLDDCGAIERALSPLQSHGLWRSVGAMIHLPMSSTVLRGRRYYREIFAHYVNIAMGFRVTLPEEVPSTSLELKDIAQMYETWAYFALVEVLNGLLGPPTFASRVRSSDFQTHVPWSFKVVWPNGTSAIYNYSCSVGTSRLSSYSLGLRPDITLILPDGLAGGGVHVFDAKFKVSWGTRKTSELGSEGMDEEHTGSFLRGDVYKMHTYRDALAGVYSAWVLYPGEEYRSFQTRSAVGGTVSGVGVIPLQPTSAATELKDVLERILISPSP